MLDSARIERLDTVLAGIQADEGWVGTLPFLDGRIKLRVGQRVTYDGDNRKVITTVDVLDWVFPPDWITKGYMLRLIYALRATTALPLVMQVVKQPEVRALLKLAGFTRYGNEESASYVLAGDIRLP